MFVYHGCDREYGIGCCGDLAQLETASADRCALGGQRLRRGRRKGAEIAVASLDDVSALTKAFEGADGLYLLVPPNYGASLWLADQRSTNGSCGRSR